MLITEDGLRIAGVPRRILLFHNSGDGHFVDQTDLIPADLHVAIGGYGSVFGDYDNDGDEDLFLPLWPHDILLRNDRGAFVPVELGVDTLGTNGAIWLDYDQDGHLDLYVADSIFLNAGSPAEATEEFVLTNRLLHNNGDGTFTGDMDAGADLQHKVRWDEGAPGPSAGSEGGPVSADFNGDGWPDLYLGMHNDLNRLFLNDGQGSFVSHEIGNAGGAFNAPVGDIDNDGDLDLFHAGASGPDDVHRSLMMLNLGDGQFIDVAESAGLGLAEVGSNVSGSAFADFDNDGDLDLVIGIASKEGPPVSLLFLNDGSGFFTDVSASSGIVDQGPFVSLGDYDEDGFVDLALGALFGLNSGLTSLYHNNGNSNHWLRVELVGTQSNRSAIGVRVLAISGDLQQMREITGGLGRNQEEAVAHFGLRERTQVDRLEIRWPSGQVDVLTDVAADQKIRVIEGQGRWVQATRTVWETRPPATMESGTEVLLSATAKPALFEPTATITSVTADLSSLGGPQSVPLQDLGDGRYQLVSQLTISGMNEHRVVEVLILQETSLGEHWIKLTHDVVVDGAMTAVLESHDPLVPEIFSLSQNYPNPFNPETTIRFDLSTSADAELSLFNMSGQRVATLLRGAREAGSYTLRWDGTDDAGRALASGMYFYRLTAEDHVETRKLMLLR
jgi:hypothetical protein